MAAQAWIGDSSQDLQVVSHPSTSQGLGLLSVFKIRHDQAPSITFDPRTPLQLTEQNLV